MWSKNSFINKENPLLEHKTRTILPTFVGDKFEQKTKRRKNNFAEDKSWKKNENGEREKNAAQERN